MLTCPACLRRCLQIGIGDLPQVSISSKTATIAFGSISTTRTYTSVATKGKLAADASSYGHKVGDKAISNSNSRQKWIESRGERPAWKENSRTANSIDEETAKELRLLRDPLKLADNVRRKLQGDNFEEAQKLVRAASKDTQCVVSWNHLISWQLNKGSLNAALKTYNEVFASTPRT
jgi:hypothetical protein